MRIAGSPQSVYAEEMMLVCEVILTIAMAAVIYFDATRFVIPNWLNGALLAVFPVMALLVPTSFDWVSPLIMFAVLFAAGFGLFALNIMGGGDVKLLAVLGLYVGWGRLGLEFVIYMSLIGGGLSVCLLLMRQIAPGIWLKLKLKTIPKILTVGEPVPYGLAIAGSFLWMVWGRTLPVFVISQ